MIRIDGRLGEGGGQILRTSLSLSLVTGRAFRIEGIRAGRGKPGLLRQHLTAVLAAAEVGSAKVEGAALGSTSLTFVPGAVRPGAYRFAVGTAGSGTLVFQTVLPALMLADGPSEVVIEGGTHNPAAPPYHYLERVFLPLVERMGPRVWVSFEKYGFYPAGGGRFRAGIEPCAALRPLELDGRGAVTTERIHAVVAHLAGGIAVREIETVREMLGWPKERGQIEQTRESAGPGNVVMIEIGTEESAEMFTAFGQVGVTAETVAGAAAREAQEYLASRAACGEHLTDQLLLPLALAGAGRFTAVKINAHARTNMAVIAEFLPVRFAVEEQAGCVTVRVER